MSELKVIDLGDIRKYIENDEPVYYEYYPKSEADKVIAELNDKLKLQTSIAEEAWKMEGIYHTSYADAVKELYEKNKELKATKRAMWLARAEWARSSALSYHLIESHPDKDVAATYKRKASKWEKVKDKCRIKAEEYK